jgi:hypothetical protein
VGDPHRTPLRYLPLHTYWRNDCFLSSPGYLTYAGILIGEPQTI